MDVNITTIALRREPGHLVRSLTALLLRVGLGLVFLVSGLAKFDAKKEGKYPQMVAKDFPEHIAFPGDVRLFTNVLPYAEVGLGAALIVGLWTPLAAFLAGVLLCVLLFGHLYRANVAMYPAMMSYLLVAAGILWLSPVTSNYLSLDGLFFGWFWRPRTEGEFHREPGEAERGGR
ncbi:MAG: DoxX family protein [Isosphaeraceae bacterium]|nr:DoxX family protein [Isosphaeraceae bacterium]